MPLLHIILFMHSKPSIRKYKRYFKVTYMHRIKQVISACVIWQLLSVAYVQGAQVAFELVM
jgi:hypothetical protein